MALSPAAVNNALQYCAVPPCAADNTLFLGVAIMVTYGVSSCLVGQTARLPLVAEAADAQVR